MNEIVQLCLHSHNLYTYLVFFFFLHSIPFCYNVVQKILTSEDVLTMVLNTSLYHILVDKLKATPTHRHMCPIHSSMHYVFEKNRLRSELERRKN